MFDKQRLGLLFECHDFVFNLDIQVVDRLVLADELKDLPPRGTVRMLEVGGQALPAWNLGLLLGLPSTTEAGVVVRVPAMENFRFCLETGPCLLVRPSERVVPLEAGLFRTRRRALDGAFVIPDTLRQRTRATVGFSLNIDGLLTSSERDVAERVLRETAPVLTAP